MVTCGAHLIMVKNHRQLKVVHKCVGLGRVQSFMLILGRVGLDHFTCESGCVRSRKLDPHPTLPISVSRVSVLTWDKN